MWATIYANLNEVFYKQYPQAIIIHTFIFFRNKKEEVYNWVVERRSLSEPFGWKNLFVCFVKRKALSNLSKGSDLAHTYFRDILMRKQFIFLPWQRVNRELNTPCHPKNINILLGRISLLQMLSFFVLHSLLTVLYSQKRITLSFEKRISRSVCIVLLRKQTIQK